ncbi:MAG TPA: M20/M25/M40 family metallo-hydrolase [Candidatus Dojkabacteria bacterium]|nr:M20/M25/M40 family metallo-hydrolase [Candidatus Dojkabacteria bacterium]
MKKEVIDKLIEFIRIDSFAFKRSEVIRAQQFVKEYLKDIPINWVSFESTNKDLAPILMGKAKKWDSKLESITLTGHIDIVYPDISDFTIKLTDDKLFGPGTADMKAGVLVILEAVKELHKKNQFKNTSEEEHFLTSHYPDFEEIAQDIENLLVYEGEGSLDVKPNINEKLLVTKRKGILGYSIKANGPGGHSGVLNKESMRHSAIHELLSQSQDILRLSDYKKGTTINIGKFNGGQALNVLAPEAEIFLDARLDSIEEYNRVKSAIEAITPKDKVIKLETTNKVNGFPVEETENNLKLFKLARQVGKEIGLEIDSVHKGGASDMNRLTSFNPEISCLDYLGPPGGGEHTKDEFLYLNTFDPCVRLSVKLIEKILQN